MVAISNNNVLVMFYLPVSINFVYSFTCIHQPTLTHTLLSHPGLLNVGDSVLAVNGTSVEGKTVDEVADTLQALQGLISFKIMPENQHCRRRARRQVGCV